MLKKDTIMSNSQKFENFLESLKGHGNDSLIESVKSGFKTCIESEEDVNELRRDLIYSIVGLIANNSLIYGANDQIKILEETIQFIKDDMAHEEAGMYANAD